MAIPLPLQEAYTLPGAQEALKSGFASALADRQAVSSLNLQTAFTVDAQGIVRPSSSYLDFLVLPSVRDVVAPWLGVDAWQGTQRLTSQNYSNEPGFVVTPDVQALYQATQTPLPVTTQTQVPEPLVTPPATTITLDTGTATIPAVVEPVQPQAPLLPLPSTGPSPLTLIPTLQGETGVQPTQGTTQWADWLRTQTAVALSELIDNLRPVLPPIFEQQLQLTQAEQDTLSAAAAVTLPVVTALEQVTDLMRPAQETIDAGLLTPLEQVRLSLSDASARVRESVLGALGAASEAITAGRTVAVGPIQAALDAAQEGLAEVAGLLEATAAEKLALAQEQIATAMAETVSADQALTQWFLSLIPQPETFTQDVIRQIRQQCENVPDAVAAAVQTGVAGGVNANLNGAIPGDLASLLGTFLGACGNLKNLALGGAAIGLLAAVVTGGAGAALELLGGLFNMLVVQGVVAQVLGAVLAPNLEVTEQDAFDACPVRIASLSTAVAAHRLGYLSDAEFHQLAQRNGYNAVQAAIEIAAQQQTLAPQDSLAWAVRRAGLADGAGNEVIAPTIRGLRQISDRAEAARPVLRQAGYREEDIDKLVEMAPYLPPVQDLLMFDRKDVFDPVVRDQFDLFSEFPENILPLTRAQGIPDEVVRLYHGASWSSPSVTQMEAMYHRLTPEPLTQDSPPVYVDGRLIGYRLISREMVEAVFRNNDVLKVFREPFLRIADNPLTRVDTRRAFVMGALDEDAVLKSYIEQGYSPENAQILLRFNKVEKEKSLLTEVGEQRRAVAVAFAGAYEHGILDESSYSFALTDLGYEPQVAALAVERSRLERHLLTLRDSVAAIKSRFIKGKLARTEAHQILESVGITPQEIERNLDIWCLQVGCDGEQTIQEKEREITKAEILSFYDDGLIGQDAAAQRITALGYSDTDARMIVANAQIKRLRANLKQAIKSVHDNFLSDSIDALTASNQLDSYGIPTETRDTLLQVWRDEHEQSEIKRAREVFIAPGDHAVEALGILGLLGLPQDEIDRLVTLWTGQKALIDAAATSANGTASSALASSVS